MLQKKFQIYVKDSIEAVRFYCRAFNAILGFHAYNDDGTYMHAEINKDGTNILFVSNWPTLDVPGTNMQFLLIFDDETELENAYEVLKENARIDCPLGPCPWSQKMTSLIDKYGVHWCLYL